MRTSVAGAEPEREAAPAAPAPEAAPAAAVLRLQATIGNRATARLLQRRELPDSMAGTPEAAEKKNWTTADRKGATAKWKEACEDNLVNLRNGEYTQIAERRDFYRWFYEATAARGYHTRWALAAHIVAGGMAEMAAVDWSEGLAPITNELQGLTRIGNQVIFDDVLPKLKKLWEGPVLTGADARKWDQAVLAEEQNLIQSLYAGLSADTMDRFKNMADMTYWRAQFGAWALGGDKVAKGPYNIEGRTPTFSSLVPGGDINTPAGRWAYGMALAKKFSTLPDYGPLDAMPAVGADYTSSAQFDRLNRMPHLHMLDAMLNDADIPEDEVVKQLKALNRYEQREQFAADPWRVVRIGGALSYSEMMDAVGALEHMRIVHKMLMLDWSLVRSWTSVDYKEIRPLILLAAKHHPEDLKLLHTDRWKKVFLDVCDDDTIGTAASDLGLPADIAAAWVKEEKAWL